MCYKCNEKDHWQCSSLRTYPGAREKFLFYCNESCALVLRNGDLGPTSG